MGRGFHRIRADVADDESGMGDHGRLRRSRLRPELVEERGRGIGGIRESGLEQERHRAVGRLEIDHHQIPVGVPPGADRLLGGKAVVHEKVVEDGEFEGQSSSSESTVVRSDPSGSRSS